MKCVNCGAELPNGAQFCQVCGTRQPVMQNPGYPGFNNSNFNNQGFNNPGFNNMGGFQEADYKDAAIWLKIVCLLIPLVGLIYFLVKRTSRPVAAKSCLTFAIIGFVINLVITLMQ